ncbi:MAG: malto-oligosyltrehalose synthase, partial [Xanthobacteraceae bacterium]
MTVLWQRLSVRPGDFKTEEQKARRQILQRSFSSQLEATLDVLSAIAQGALVTRDISRSALRRCLIEILVQFPVYRIYAQVGNSTAADAAFLSHAVARAAQSCLPSDRWLVHLLGKWLVGERIRSDADTLQTVALTRFEQLTAPLSAKAVEDTAFYRYGRLLSRNDVGFDPGRFACSAAEFHQRMQMRKQSFPDALLATATHDHKRGEDVRARLAAFSEIADEWSATIEHWLTLSATQFQQPGLSIDAADRTMLFQTLVGAWPMDLSIDDRDGMDRFAKRIVAWQQKSLREAKLHTDWSEPDGAYESAAAESTSRLMREPSSLLAEIADLARRISAAGAVNGLAQVLAKLAAPGVPDFYQGTEFWDLSLVDPDNRAPVDFAARQQSLATASSVNMDRDWTNGRIKQLVIARVLAARKKFSRLFAAGDYVPLEIEGS